MNRANIVSIVFEARNENGQWDRYAAGYTDAVEINLSDLAYHLDELARVLECDRAEVRAMMGKLEVRA